MLYCFGPIDGWAKEYMSQDFLQRFQQILEYMKNGMSILQKHPELKGKLDPSILEEYKALLDEETDWFQSAKQDQSISFQEELMYIVSRLLTLASSVKNMGDIQSHVQTQIMQSCNFF